MGFFIMAIGLILTPLQGSIAWLMVSRGVFAIGVAAATAMLATIAADYVENKDRGKANAIMGIMNGFGAVAAAIGFAKLPKLFQAFGQDGLQAGRSSYFLAAGLATLFGLIMLWGLRKATVIEKGDEAHSLPFITMIRQGLGAARQDLGVSLSYAAAFVARADLAVAGVFFPLWLTRHLSSHLDPQLSLSERLLAIDMAAASGVAAGGKLIAIIGSAGLVFAPVIGILCDRINRVQALIFGLGLNVLGYGLTFFVTDPSGSGLAAIAVIIGFGQVGAVISSQVLIQELAPPAMRGSIIGCFGTFGAFGIMVSLLGGGWLFDRWTEAGPFVFLALMNLLVLLAAIWFKAPLSRKLKERHYAHALTQVKLAQYGRSRS
ncbi:MAG: MFS transporter [Proteobacteria bacterium]|nr:MFS transporter [Pseudomonadota bacterium]